MPHTFWHVVSSFPSDVRVFQVSIVIFSTHWFLRSIWFNFLMSEDCSWPFCCWFLPESLLSMNPAFWNTLRFALWHNIYSLLVMFHEPLKRNVYSAFAGYSSLQMTILSIWLRVFFKCSIAYRFLIYLFYKFLKEERFSFQLWVWICLFLVNFCFMYSEALF